MGIRLSKYMGWSIRGLSFWDDDRFVPNASEIYDEFIEMDNFIFEFGQFIARMYGFSSVAECIAGRKTIDNLNCPDTDLSLILFYLNDNKIFFNEVKRPYELITCNNEYGLDDIFMIYKQRRYGDLMDSYERDYYQKTEADAIQFSSPFYPDSYMYDSITRTILSGPNLDLLQRMVNISKHHPTLYSTVDFNKFIDDDPKFSFLKEVKSLDDLRNRLRPLPPLEIKLLVLFMGIFKNPYDIWMDFMPTIYNSYG